ncbi:hypothetical protein EDB86DRAFT_3100092 [Lactarius hatsudake]|nr:hypothetical protein EDB86DRAFT_3100092 [Lactarius hatsudake]
MSGYPESIADPEQGQPVSLGGEAWSLGDLSYHNPGGGTTGNPSSEGPFPAGSHKERRDFDDGANALWSLYGKEAKTHDEAQIVSLADDMDGVLLFAGLFSAVLTSFLVQSLQRLQVNPADQSVYYQNQSVYYQQQSAYYQQQSVAILAQISQQIASAVLQVSVPSTATSPTVPQPSVLSTAQQVFIPSTAQQVSPLSTSPPPYPAFTPSFPDIRVNAFWLVSLVCSLSAALLAILIQQWVRSYMQVFQRYDHPLKRARFRQFFFEGAKGMRKLAEQVPRLIHVSLFLFFFGLGDSMLNTNTTVGVTTIILICICASCYLYIVSAQLRNLQSPYKTLISYPIFFLMQRFPRPYFGDGFLRKLRTAPTSIEKFQEELVMGETEERKDRDVRAIRWLVDNTTVNAEMEPLVLAIPGTFNTEWGREVWTDVSSQGRSDPDTLESQTDHSSAGGQVSLAHHSLHPIEGTAVDTICRCVRNLFETCNNHSYFPNEEARRRRMRACAEAAASLVCCIHFRLEWLGDVGKLVSEIGHIEKINQSPTTTSDPSFIVRWTCLSLVAVQQILCSNRLQVLAGYAVSGLGRFQSEYGQPDEVAWRGAQRIEECLKTAWRSVEELRRAFEPLSQKRTSEQVEEILRNHERQISELERIKVEADSMEDVDWRISLYQDAMDDATFRLMRQLPGVSFDEPHRSESSPISDTFNTPATGSGPVAPQLIFPGQRVQALARLGLKLREVLDRQVADGPQEVLESLKSVDRVPMSLRRPDGLMKRQLWRLQDLRDGGGLGFTVELFFLSLRQLLSIPSLHESNSVFYIGTFKIITSHWEKGRELQGTQHILLNVICDLIIQGRGVFSDISYPESVTSNLFDMVGDMLQGYAGPDEHIHDAVQEIKSVDSRRCMDVGLQRRALTAIHRHWPPQSSNPIHVANSVS